MPRKVYDAIVVGSGAAGGIAARKLTEAGLEVLLLEAGPDRTAPGGDDPQGLPQTQAPREEAGIARKLGDHLDRVRLASEVLEQTGSEVASAFVGQPNLQKMVHLRTKDPRGDYPRQPIQVESPAFGSSCAQLYIDDDDSPYMAPSNQPYHWIRGRQLGGRTQIWKRMTPRFTQDELKSPARDGAGEPWPLDYKDLHSHYEYVERALRVVGAVEAGAAPYEGALAARTMTSAENDMAQLVAGLRSNCRVTLAPYASPFGPGEAGNLERAVNHYDQGGHPAHDCSVRHSIWHARQTGRLTVRTGAVVRHLTLDKDTARASGVLFIDSNTKTSQEVHAKVVVLAASALESTRILLNSRSEQWPTGLANSSGTLGRYLHDHMFGVGAVGIKTAAGQAESFPPILIPNFRNRATDAPSKSFIRGYQTAGYFGAMRAGPLRRWNQTLTLSSHGEVTPQFDNRIEIDASMVDAWGIPVPRILFKREPNDRAMCGDMLDSAVEFLERGGFEVILRSPEPLLPGASIHEGGTARMGADPKTSVLNRHCQSWDVPNVYVTDGAAFTTAGYQNPMLSIMALSSLACDHMVGELKAGRL